MARSMTNVSDEVLDYIRTTTLRETPILKRLRDKTAERTNASWTVSPEQAPDKPTYLELGFENGDIVSIDGEKMSPAQVLTRLNEVGGANGVGRLDIVENRYVGMKSRGCYDTPGGAITHDSDAGALQIEQRRGRDADDHGNKRCGHLPGQPGQTEQNNQRK